MKWNKRRSIKNECNWKDGTKEHFSDVMLCMLGGHKFVISRDSFSPPFQIGLCANGIATTIKRLDVRKYP